MELTWKDSSQEPEESDSPQTELAIESLKSKGRFPVSNSPFSLNPDQLSTLIDPKDPWVLKAIGGPEALAQVLVTDPTHGLPAAQLGSSELEQRRKIYGENILPERKSNGLLKIMLMTLDDKVLIILIIAAIISLALGLYETFGEEPQYFRDGTKKPQVDWVEGVAILVAVVIVTVVGSVNDWQKERQFAKLNRKKEHRLIEVVRSGTQQQVAVEDVVAGDIVLVEPGDILAVDGVTIHSNDIECDESSVTGESDTLKKVSASEAMAVLDKTQSAKRADCLMISGSKVLQGTGRYMVTAVGENSMWGRTMLSLHEGTEVTPLQEKLNRIADGIAKFGVWSALILFIVLFIRFLVQISGHNRLSDLPSSQKGNRFMDIFIVSITIIVVAVPEGLPLAVTLALAFATTRMVKDNCLVRVLKSCETMGGATSVCSDKTGTLTQNKMTVVRSLLAFKPWRAEKSDEETSDEISLKGRQDPNIATGGSGGATGGSADATGGIAVPSLTTLVRDSICLNSSVYEEYQDPETLIGSKTEIALVNNARLQFGLKVGELQKYRESHDVCYVLPFDSSRKFMLTIERINDDGHYRMYVKGAAEIVCQHATTALSSAAETNSASETVVKFEDEKRDSITKVINEYGDDALRCISIAYKDFSIPKPVNWSDLTPEELDYENLTFIGLFGIQDPLRPGVRDAVKQCQRAGVVVRMVTGDNMRTARAIAINASIIPADAAAASSGYDAKNDSDIIIMEGPEFRKLSDDEVMEIAPRVLVLARSSPQDKRRLVEMLKAHGETVAVTGDGTNDAPALRLADVGFSMGQSGTEVAKEASDIIIMDDNFTSIVKALKWGRTVNDAVKKFLQFQLTVNVTAVTLTFVSAVASSSNESVLTAVQLLWVNLIMDTLAALALATDAPTDAVLDRAPDNRAKSLITPTMWKMIFSQSIFQLGVTFVLHFAGRQIWGYPKDLSPDDETRLSAMVFNAFVWMQFFNMLVNRRLDNKQNLFVGITKNPFFPLIMLIIGGFQVLIMFVGGAAFHIKRSTGSMWATAIICGFCSIPMGMLARLIPDDWIMRLYPRRAWHFLMTVLDSVEFGFLWVMTPVVWVATAIGHGVLRLFGKKPDPSDQIKKGSGSNSLGGSGGTGVGGAVGGGSNHTQRSSEEQYLLGPSNYDWVPGIEKSIAELSFLRKVRGGRSRQLKFFRRNESKEAKKKTAARSSNSVHSVNSDVSALAAFMAPMVVGGAVGGWAPHPKTLQQTR